MKPARHREVSFEAFEAESISNYEAKFKAAEEVASLAESGQVIGQLGFHGFSRRSARSR